MVVAVAAWPASAGVVEACGSPLAKTEKKKYRTSRRRRRSHAGAGVMQVKGTIASTCFMWTGGGVNTCGRKVLWGIMYYYRWGGVDRLVFNAGGVVAVECYVRENIGI